MKTRLVFVTILCCLTLSSAFANEGGKAKKASSAKKSVSSQASTKKTPVKTKVLSTTVNSAAFANEDSLDPNSAFNELYVPAANVSSGIRLNPRALTFVQDYMDRNTEDLMKLRDWGRPYFKTIDGIFAQHGLPVELKYLAVIESKLKTSAVSWVGAVGPWQFMPGTARALGLQVNARRDDRRDYVRSTHAAAKYLKDLFREFNDWLLVIAAYNGGPGVVYNAIKKSKSRNFWDLQYYLPAESRNHVKKFIGTHYIFEGQGGITTLTRQEATEQIGSTALLLRKLTAAEKDGSKTLNISGKYSSVVIARNVLMDIAEFNRYNPEFDKIIASADNSYELKLPAEKMDLFIANKYNILNESVNLLLTGSAFTSPDQTQVFANK